MDKNRMWFGEISFLKEDLVSDFLVLLFTFIIVDKSNDNKEAGQ